MDEREHRSQTGLALKEAKASEESHALLATASAGLEAFLLKSCSRVRRFTLVADTRADARDELSGSAWHSG